MRLSRRQVLECVAALSIAVSVPTFASAAEEFKMGLLVPGSVAEEGWNKIAYDALKQVEKELGAKISYVELSDNPAAFEKAFRDYASHGYQVVLGHGFQFQDAALTTAEDFPDTVFLVSSSYIHEGNVIGLNTDASQPFYLMGVIAASLGKGSGLIGGMEIPPIAHAFDGFERGAKSVNPDFPVSKVFINSFTDASAAKEAAVSMIARGADFVVPNANAAGLGVIQAAQEAGEKASTFSVYSEYTDVAPKNILGTFLADYGRGIVRIVSDIKNGNVPQSNVDFGLKDKDVIKFTLNDEAAKSIPQDLRKHLEEVTAKIVSGEIQTRAQ
ncbi:BMP family protein [Shinella zoogloeoides]|uniref:BMP family ABC transporter substrate-binding protein n=1 Tax=Shinella zoogloeoides TaxID=352475 RepID=A0A6N8TFW3_SHIZO|nr:BMP family protein [Shinella zoogloeoides]MXO01066.1 BMP family ABC transporter substrate-binding protein [Shinella zoogloeoides]UEX84117.1 BMP family protein [Shinella zoogloeoides]